MNFNIPTTENVSEDNKRIFGSLKENVGFVPNLYATFAHSNNALKTYLAFSGSPTSLTSKEKEVVALAVSQVNHCNYCLAAHTAMAKGAGFTDDQIIAIRKGKVDFDAKLEALTQLSMEITEHRGNPSAKVMDAFFGAGYTEENFIDVLLIVGDKTITNYLYKATKIPIDFPEAAPLA